MTALISTECACKTCGDDFDVRSGGARACVLRACVRACVRACARDLVDDVQRFTCTFQMNHLFADNPDTNFHGVFVDWFFQ